MTCVQYFIAALLATVAVLSTIFVVINHRAQSRSDKGS
jgi:hypothetical protein